MLKENKKEYVFTSDFIERFGMIGQDGKQEFIGSSGEVYIEPMEEEDCDKFLSLREKFGISKNGPQFIFGRSLSNESTPTKANLGKFISHGRHFGPFVIG